MQQYQAGKNNETLLCFLLGWGKSGCSSIPAEGNLTQLGVGVSNILPFL